MTAARVSGAHKPGPWARQGLAVVDVEGKVVGRFLRAADAQLAAASVEALHTLATLVCACYEAIERYERDVGPAPSAGQLAFGGTAALVLATATNYGEAPEVQRYASLYRATRTQGPDATVTAEMVGARRNLIVAQALRVLQFVL